MELNEFMTAIGLSEEAKKIVEQTDFPVSPETKELFCGELAEKRYEGSRPDCILSLFVRYLAAYGEKIYAETGIGRSEWLDTMRDLTLWNEQLYTESGERGLRETHWLAHLVKGEIFRLGRLQFIPRISSERISFDGRVFSAGTRYCEVHIPKGESLSPCLVDRSFSRAKELLRPDYYVCESWLLSPRLKEMLKGGNILSFAARFSVAETDFKDRSAERYIFGKIGNPEEYLPRNGFAGKVKEAALRGEFLGSACGYCAASVLE